MKPYASQSSACPSAPHHESMTSVVQFKPNIAGHESYEGTLYSDSSARVQQLEIASTLQFCPCWPCSCRAAAFKVSTLWACSRHAQRWSPAAVLPSQELHHSAASMELRP